MTSRKENNTLVGFNPQLFLECGNLRWAMCSQRGTSSGDGCLYWKKSAGTRQSSQCWPRGLLRFFFQGNCNVSTSTDTERELQLSNHPNFSYQTLISNSLLIPIQKFITTPVCRVSTESLLHFNMMGIFCAKNLAMRRISLKSGLILLGFKLLRRGGVRFILQHSWLNAC